MEEVANTENPLLFSKEDVYGNNLITYSQINEDNNDDFIDIFDYDNLCMEYSFKTGNAALYIKNSDYQYELLYESNINDGIQNSSLYSKDSVYILTNYNPNTGTIGGLDYIPKNVFINFMNTFGKEYKNIFSKKISELLSIPYMVKHFVKMVSDNNYYNNSSNQYIFDNYRRLFVKYTSATILIPVYNILSDFIEDIYKYIATGKFDNSIFEKRFFELQNFKDFCPDSTSIISSFIKNPKVTDLHQLCNSLEKNLNNIDNLINLYLEDELSLQKEGEEL